MMWFVSLCSLFLKNLNTFLISQAYNWIEQARSIPSEHFYKISSFLGNLGRWLYVRIIYQLQQVFDLHES